MSLFDTFVIKTSIHRTCSFLIKMSSRIAYNYLDIIKNKNCNWILNCITHNIAYIQWIITCNIVHCIIKQRSKLFYLYTSNLIVLIQRRLLMTVEKLMENTNWFIQPVSHKMQTILQIGAQNIPEVLQLVQVRISIPFHLTLTRTTNQTPVLWFLNMSLKMI